MVAPSKPNLDSGRFRTFPNVPVMVEHETRARDGRTLRFGRAELEAVAARCNRRIDETGDYAAISLGHTPDPGEQKPYPELVGLAGPFRVDRYGDKWAILGDVHVFAEDVPRLKRYPRRSPELWLEEDYAQMYLDPIALLGAEAPRLDMGLLLYSAQRNGRLVEKYAAVAPAAMNVFVPGDDGREPPERHQKSDEEPSMAPEDIQQFLSALAETAQWKYLTKLMEEADAGGKPPDAAARDKFAADQGTGTTPPPPPAPDPDDKRGAEKYAKLNLELTQAQRELATLRGQVEAERGHRVNAERYARLYELRQRYAFDLDDIVAATRYGKMQDAEFDGYCSTVEKYFQRIPVGEGLPTWSPAADDAAAGPGKTEKYAKDLADEALAVCKRKLAAGEKADYAAELENLRRGKTP